MAHPKSELYFFEKDVLILSRLVPTGLDFFTVADFDFL